jgi:hypothetical protein
MAKKKPNRRPNRTCQECGAPFYGAPSQDRLTCSFRCRTEHLRRSGNLLTGAKPGSENPRWRGGRFLHQGRYWLVLRPDHPQADNHGYVREHRLVMEGMLGRFLLPTEVVHHRNHDSTDNRPENLQLFASNAEHKRSEHLEGRSGLERR